MITVSAESMTRIIKRCLNEFDEIDRKDEIASKFEQNEPFVYEYIAMAGGGYKTSQYVGFLAYCLRHKLINKNTKFVGSSLGSCCSVLAIIGYHLHDPNIKMSDNAQLIQLLSEILRHTTEARLNIFDVCGNWWNIWEKTLANIVIKHIKNDEMVDQLFNHGKLNIICTKLLPLPSKQIFKHFNDRNELIDCLCASCMIPFWSFNKPWLYFKNNLYLDGGFSELIPKGYAKEKYKNLIVYNQTVWYRTFIPLKTENEYVDDIVQGYTKCKHMSHRNLNDSRSNIMISRNC